MKFLIQGLNQFQGMIKSLGFTELLLQVLLRFQEKIKSIRLKNLTAVFMHRSKMLLNRLRAQGFSGTMRLAMHNTIGLAKKIGTVNYREIPAYSKRQLWRLDARVRAIGYADSLDDFEKRKLGLFNQLIFLGLITGIIAPIAGIFDDDKLPTISWIVAFLPGIVSMLVLLLNHNRKYEIAMMAYFILQPFVTSLVYLGGINLGVELFFILYGILSVFFLQRLNQMLFSLALSMISYFMLAVVLKNYQYQLETASLYFYLFNQILAIVFIFYGLYLIKEENTSYQFSILNKNRELHRVNLEIEKQKTVIADKAALLEQQTVQLTELNSLKNKLFSVISHDLKTPMYALRNLFSNIQQYDLSAEEVKALIPDVVNDLNYTTGLMENLLQWAKNQMRSSTVNPQMLDVTALIDDVCGLLRLQAEAKRIHVSAEGTTSALIYADKDMVHLVLRNLLSNAIKFTPEDGNVCIEVTENGTMTQVAVKDSGVGISEENLQKLFNEYYTSKGTANESGTGLGLMLCKEFLTKNGGQLKVSSEEGKGSVFSFTLPKASIN
ncbi:MAG TPA: HAMP domain-containing sensor histidine kinase [Chitinophagaceae bacterium]|nr:HAMP domain-containing sensor histidine kinase [Chitinophagaceae bacterium]